MNWDEHSRLLKRFRALNDGMTLAQWRKKQRAAWKELGLCIACGHERDEEFSQCSKCRKRGRERQRGLRRYGTRESKEIINAAIELRDITEKGFLTSSQIAQMRVLFKAVSDYERRLPANNLGS